MKRSSLRAAGHVGLVVLAAGLLAGCGSISLGNFGLGGGGPTPPPQDSGLGPDMPGTIRSDEIVGRWGLASFHKPEDQKRTEAAARNQCKQPYVINSGPSGGVIMQIGRAHV